MEVGLKSPPLGPSGNFHVGMSDSESAPIAIVKVAILSDSIGETIIIKRIISNVINTRINSFQDI